MEKRKSNSFDRSVNQPFSPNRLENNSKSISIHGSFAPKTHWKVHVFIKLLQISSNLLPWTIYWFYDISCFIMLLIIWKWQTQLYVHHYHTSDSHSTWKPHTPDKRFSNKHHRTTIMEEQENHNNPTIKILKKFWRQTTFETKIWFILAKFTSEWIIMIELVEPTKYAQNIKNATPNTSRRRCIETLSHGVQSIFMVLLWKFLQRRNPKTHENYLGVWNQCEDWYPTLTKSQETMANWPTLLFQFVFFSLEQFKQPRKTSYN